MTDELRFIAHKTDFQQVAGHFKCKAAIVVGSHATEESAVGQLHRHDGGVRNGRIGFVHHAASDVLRFRAKHCHANEQCGQK